MISGIFSYPQHTTVCRASVQTLGPIFQVYFSAGQGLYRQCSLALTAIKALERNSTTASVRHEQHMGANPRGEHQRKRDTY